MIYKRRMTDIVPGHIQLIFTLKMVIVMVTSITIRLFICQLLISRYQMI